MSDARIEHLRISHDRALDRVESARRELRAARFSAPNDEATRRRIELLSDAVCQAERDASYLELRIIEATEAA
jgi:hypothetical protein